MKKIASIIISIMIISSAIGLVGCESKENLNIKVNKDIKRESSIDLKELSKYKGTKIGDSTKISNILEYLPGNTSKDGFSLQTKKQPYEITVNYKLGNEYKENNITNLLYTNSVILLSLVDNLDIVNIRLGEEHGIIYTYNRGQIEEVIKTDLRKLPQDLKLWKDVLSKESYDNVGEGRLKVGNHTSIIETSETDKTEIAKTLFEALLIYDYGNIKVESGEYINILKNYKIKNVTFKSDLDNGDFRVSMNYDIQSVDGYVDYFTTGNGIKSSDNWIKDKFVIVDIEKIGENQYKLAAQNTN
ncbi:DUF4825 domain-containing protein [[Clostridium] dakarense]|uniref:DUF4825 domain-containing protein n=1 Tax=Faecalimicrobium dakarense TaxID=1301100 RepID=UPI0004B07B15|nr:DUF4825 domain-containing protein [[Clostridium] dakarense]